MKPQLCEHASCAQASTHLVRARLSSCCCCCCCSAARLWQGDAEVQHLERPLQQLHVVPVLLQHRQQHWQAHGANGRLRLRVRARVCGKAWRVVMSSSRKQQHDTTLLRPTAAAHPRVVLEQACELRHRVAPVLCMARL
jgi:hypothetical protein